MSPNRPRPFTHRPRIIGSVDAELAQAEELLRRRKYAEAEALLQNLAQKHPNHPEVYRQLTNLYASQQQVQEYLEAVHHLSQLVPDEADVAYVLAGAYLSNGFYAQHILQARRCLQGWPEHARAAEMGKLLARMEAETVQDWAIHSGRPYDELLEILSQNDETLRHIRNNRFDQAQEVAEKLAASHPEFMPAWNNISQIYIAQGQTDLAIQTARQVLEHEADNVHALGNLARMYFLSGKGDEAQEYCRRLKASTRPASDRLHKIAETLALLGDVDGLLALHQQAEKAGTLKRPDGNAWFYHYTAYAWLVQGDEKQARSLWKKALAIDPDCTPARANLDDLRKPPGERHAPWACSFSTWLSPQAQRDLETLARQGAQKGGEAIAKRNTREFMGKHPELIFLAPHMLERGDESSRRFFVEIAAAYLDERLSAALYTFATGQRGPDELRLQAIMLLLKQDFIPSGLIRIWRKGKQTDILLTNFDIYTEAEESSLPEEAQALAEEAAQALYNRDGAKGQALLERAIQIAPNDPSLRNNLAAAYQIQGKAQASRDLLREIFARFPDYFFARTAMARVAIQERRMDEARQLLAPLLRQHRLHISEFNALCEAEIELWMTEGNGDGARSWLHVWEQVNPDDPSVIKFNIMLKMDQFARKAERRKPKRR